MRTRAASRRRSQPWSPRRRASRPFRSHSRRRSRHAAGKSLSIDGTVCITASELIAAHVLPPILGRLRLTHPGIEIEIVASNTARDLRAEGSGHRRSQLPRDAGRISWPRSRRPRRAPLRKPRLPRATRQPDLARGLSHADFFGFDRDLMIKGLRALGLELGPKNFPIVTDNHLVQWELAKARRRHLHRDGRSGRCGAPGSSACS